MNRRTFLAAGFAATAGTAGLAGCLGSITGGDSDGSSNPDPDSFETVERDGVQVPLAPIDVVYRWYTDENEPARMVDARSRTAYDAAHIEGAVLSSAPDGVENDPVADWPKGDRIICYCGCPHHLSSMRAASLIQDGYENVMVIDEGFGAWRDAGYPMAGSDVEDRPEPQTIRGRTDATFAGEDAWARHEPSGQMEATAIGSDGGYELVLKFVDVDADSIIAIETPEYRFDAPLGELVGEVVTPETATE